MRRYGCDEAFGLGDAFIIEPPIIEWGLGVAFIWPLIIWPDMWPDIM